MVRLTRLASALAAFVVVPFVAVPAVTASAPAQVTASDEATVTAGELLPGVPQPAFRGFAFESQSTRGQSAYVAFRVPWLAENVLDSPVAIMRSSDGAIVREVSSYYSFVRLVGDSYVVTDGNEVVFRDIETGVETGRIPIDSGEQVLTYTSSSVLVRTPPDEGPADYLLEIRRTDGPTTPLASAGGLPTTEFLSLSAVDGNTAYLRNNLAAVDTHWRVDLTTGATVRLNPPTVDMDWTLRVTTTRLIWHRPAGDDFELRWADKGGANPGQVILPGADIAQLRPYGARLAAVVRHDTVPETLSVHPVDLTEGALEEPVVEGAATALAELSGGQLAVALPGGQNGVLTTLEDGQEPQIAGPLPPAGRPVRLGLSGDVVSASVYVGSDIGPGFIAHVLQLVDGEWTRPVEEVPLITHSSNQWGPLQAAGDVLLTKQSLDAGEGLDLHRLTWPGGHRDVEAGDQSVKLGHGGQFVSRYVPNVGWETQDVKTGEVVGGFEIVDRNYGYGEIDSLGRLTRTDLTGETDPETLTLGVTCLTRPAQLVDVRGRWARAWCDGREQFLDLQGVRAPRVLFAENREGFELGNGFAVWSQWRSGGTPVIKALDLVTGEVRSYGPTIGGRNPYPDVAVDDAGGPAFVYNDDQHRVRKVTLDWLATAPATKPDSTPPVLAAATGSSGVLAKAGATLTFGYGASDPQAVSSYDVQVRRAARWSRIYDAWEMLRTHTPYRSVQVWAPPGEQFCLRFRARDGYGNRSTWSQARCSAVAFDDRGMRAPASAVRGSSPLAIKGTYTALRREGSHLTANLGGRRLGLWVLRGPNQGSLDVHANGRFVKRVALSAPTTRRAFVVVDPGRWFDFVELYQAGRRPVRVDAATGLR